MNLRKRILTFIIPNNPIPGSITGSLIDERWQVSKKDMGRIYKRFTTAEKNCHNLKKEKKANLF